MAIGIHTEATFEATIEQSLTEDGGYCKGFSKDFNSEQGIFPSYVISFLENSQPRQWEKISKIHGEEVSDKVIRRLLQEMDLKFLTNSTILESLQT